MPGIVVLNACEVTDADQSASALAGQNAILELVASGMPLEVTLDAICGHIEGLLPGAICSILLLDETGLRLHHGASRGLPSAYKAAIDGVAMGEGVGSCGTSAFRRETVIVSDIATDPLWESWKDVALAHDLQACWSTPILGQSNDRILGTFAVYHHQPQSPTVSQQLLLGQTSHLAGVAIEHQRAPLALAQSEERFRTLVQHASDITAILTADGIVTYASPAAWGVLDYSLSLVLVGRNVMAIIHPADRDLMRDIFAPHKWSDGIPLPRFEVRVQGRSGAWHWLEVIATSLLENPSIRGIVINARIVTDRKAVELQRDETLARELVARRAAELAEQRYRELVHGLDAIVWETEVDESTFSFVSQYAETLLGYPISQWMEEPDFWIEHVHPDDRHHVRTQSSKAMAELRDHEIEYRMIAADGRAIWLRDLAVVRSMNGRSSHVHGVIVDISESKAAEERLRNLALTDSLTHLANRTLFMDRHAQAIQRLEREDSGLAVLFIDLDSFKLVNDGYGHAIGDQLLILAGYRLNQAVQEPNTLARWGGDEFTVLLEHVEAPRAAGIDMAQRILRTFREPFLIGERELIVTPSIGIAVTTPGLPASDLVREADVALYRAKAAGRGQYVLFNPSMSEGALTTLKLESDFQRALARGEFLLEYEPLVDLATGQVQGLEALVRWRHPELGMLPPSEFIPMAEQSGLIVSLGRWVLHEACRQVSAWQHEFSREMPISISVNVSARQVQDPQFIADVTEALETSGLPRNQLQLELTESSAMEHPEMTNATLNDLAAQGIRLVIDDFGTGYSGLAVLQRLPIVGLKVDREFVKGLGHDAATAAVIRAVMTLAQDLDLQVTAEGIETIEQLAHLRSLGCKHGQGYAFSRSLSAADMGALLRKTAPFAGIVMHGAPTSLPARSGTS